MFIRQGEPCPTKKLVLAAYGFRQLGNLEVGGEDEGGRAPFAGLDGLREHPESQGVVGLAVEDDRGGAGPVAVVDHLDGDGVAELPADRSGEGVVPDRLVIVGHDRSRAVGDPGDLDDHAEVGRSAKGRAELGVERPPAECDLVLAWRGNLVPPFEVAFGFGDPPPFGMLGQVVAELAGDLADVVGMGDEVVVGSAVGIGIPCPEDLVLGLDRLADVPAPLGVGLEVIAIAVDPLGEVGRAPPGKLASLVDVAVVERLDQVVEQAVGLGAEPALRVLDKKLAGLLDQVRQVGVGQVARPDQVVEDLALPAGDPRVNLGPERGEHRVGLGPMGRVGELAEELLDRLKRGVGLVGIAGGLGLDLLPAGLLLLVLLVLLDVVDRDGQGRRPLLQRGELGGGIGLGGPDADAGRRGLDGPLIARSQGHFRVGGPEKAERRMPLEQVVPLPGDRRRGVVSPGELDGLAIAQIVVPGQRAG